MSRPEGGGDGGEGVGGSEEENGDVKGWGIRTFSRADVHRNAHASSAEERGKKLK